jgi:uncharacterized protein (DUF305 family)
MRKHLTAVLAMVGALALAACSDNSSDSTSSDSPALNASDVAFATDMIPHHLQAVEMAEYAETQAQSPEVQALAQQILEAQAPEIETMSGWLTSWNKPIPADMRGMDMSGSMPGMMSPDDMDTLMKSTGADFDQLFLTMMIEHHEGAIEMAKNQQAEGMYPEAIELAKQIEAAQAAEIATMQGLLQ